MKLFVIVLCLLSERFVVHRLSHSRFDWFASYFENLKQKLPSQEPALILALVVLPLVLLCGLSMLIFDHILFGILGFLLNLFVFYYCLGPNNTFYPIREETDEIFREAEVGNYFAKANGQLFAVIFWYILLGPLAVLCYRLISLCCKQRSTAELATKITNLLDWIPARLTLLLYLLVGNFQKGVHFFIQKMLSPPENNKNYLSEGGLLAAHTNEDETIQLPYAESLVEHALIVYLVFIALFTLVAWLK